TSMFHYDGMHWTSATVPDGAAIINAFWAFAPNDIYAAGGFRAFHYDGSAWSLVRYTGAEIATIWGSSPTDVYATGPDDGEATEVQHWNGATWSTVTTCSAPFYLGVAGTSASDVYLLTGNGICHYDGMSWTMIDATTPDVIRQISATDVMTYKGSTQH